MSRYFSKNTVQYIDQMFKYADIFPGKQLGNIKRADASAVVFGGRAVDIGDFFQRAFGVRGFFVFNTLTVGLILFLFMKHIFYLFFYI